MVLNWYYKLGVLDRMRQKDIGQAWNRIRLNWCINCSVSRLDGIIIWNMIQKKLDGF